jgi:hypothetical protein
MLKDSGYNISRKNIFSVLRGLCILKCSSAKASSSFAVSIKTVVRNSARAVEFYMSAFGAVETCRAEDPEMQL